MDRADAITVTRRVVMAIAAGVTAAGALTSCSDRQPHDVRARPPAARWSKTFAEQRLAARPPLRWRLRAWRIVDADCSGHGQARRTNARAVYPDFSCAVTVVKPSHDCPSRGRYECVEGFESTVITRTLHVVSARKYALYRP